MWAAAETAVYSAIMLPNVRGFSACGRPRERLDYRHVAGAHIGVDVCEPLVALSPAHFKLAVVNTKCAKRQWTERDADIKDDALPAI